MFEKLGFNDDTEVKISAYDTRDRFTATRTLLGSATILMKEMKEIGDSNDFYLESNFKFIMSLRSNTFPG